MVSVGPFQDIVGVKWKTNDWYMIGVPRSGEPYAGGPDFEGEGYGFFGDVWGSLEDGEMSFTPTVILVDGEEHTFDEWYIGHLYTVSGPFAPYETTIIQPFGTGNPEVLIGRTLTIGSFAIVLGVDVPWNGFNAFQLEGETFGPSLGGKLTLNLSPLDDRPPPED